MRSSSRISSVASGGKPSRMRAPTTPAENTSSTPPTRAVRTPRWSCTMTSAAGCVTTPVYLAVRADETPASDTQRGRPTARIDTDYGASAASRRSVYGRMPPSRNTSQLERRVDARAIVSNSVPSANTRIVARQRTRLGERVHAGAPERPRDRSARARPTDCAVDGTRAAAHPSRRGSNGGCARSSRRAPPGCRAAANPSPPSRATTRSRTPCPRARRAARLRPRSASRRRRSSSASPSGRCTVTPPSVPGASRLRRRTFANVPRTITSWLPRREP